MNFHTLGRLAPMAALLLALAPPTHAESSFQSGSGTLSASARLDFRITVPKFLYLRVGNGTSMGNSATVDLIDFVVPAANVGDGSPIAATAPSGDLATGAVTARVMGNNGDVTLTSTTLGALSNGGGDTVSFGQISTAVTTLTSPTALAHPTLADGTTTSTTVPATGKIVNRDARWTFSYNNSALVPAGTYGGVNTNNGRVTYTASMP